VPNHAGDLSRATGHLRAAVAKRRGRPPAAQFLLQALQKFSSPNLRSLRVLTRAQRTRIHFYPQHLPLYHLGLY
jgi:hypothetical protein